MPYIESLNGFSCMFVESTKAGAHIEEIEQMLADFLCILLSNSAPP